MRCIVSLLIELFVSVRLTIFKPKQQIMLFTFNTTILRVTNETAFGGQKIMCSVTDSTAEKISKIFAYYVILLGSFFGNIFIIIIVNKHRDLRKTINYFIVNMAVSDLLSSLIMIPVFITGLLTDSWHWRVHGILGLIFCKLYYFVGRVSLLVSAQSLVWIAIDRFMAIVFPIKLGLITNKIRTRAIVSTWIFAVLLNSPSLIISRLIQNGSYTTCHDTGTIFTDNKASKAYNVLQVIFHLFVPMCLVSILYIAIAIALKRKSKALVDNAANVQQHSLKKRKQGIQMAVVIVMLFYICVIPFISLVFIPDARWTSSCALQRVFIYLAFFMLLSTSIVNPVICLSFVESYRRGLKNILCPCIKLRHNNMAKRKQITIKGIKTLPGENCPQTSKELGNLHEGTLDTVL